VSDAWTSRPNNRTPTRDPQWQIEIKDSFVAGLDVVAWLRFQYPRRARGRTPRQLDAAGQGGHCLNVLKTFTEASLSVKAGSVKKTVQLIVTAQPSRPLVREHDVSDLGRLVDLRPVPRVKRVKGGVPGLGFEVLGDADMKIGVGVPPDEQEGQVGAP
jgi:hypothetical protein